MPCSTSNSGVLKRCSFARWFEITGLPVRSAKAVLGGQEFHDFAVFRAQSFRRHAGGVIEHADQARALQRKDSEFGKEFLLANALAQRAAGQVIVPIVTR